MRLEEQRLGLSDSMLAQLGHFFSDLGHCSFGTSWQTNLPVRTEIGPHLPITLQLVAMAAAVALIVGIPLGYVLSTGRGPAATGTVCCASSRSSRVLSRTSGGAWSSSTCSSSCSGSSRPRWDILSPTAVPPTPVTGFILIDSLLRGQFSTFFDALDHFALPS